MVKDLRRFCQLEIQFMPLKILNKNPVFKICLSRITVFKQKMFLSFNLFFKNYENQWFNDHNLFRNMVLINIFVLFYVPAYQYSRVSSIKNFQ